MADSVVLPSSSGDPPAPTDVIVGSASAVEHAATTAEIAEPPGLSKCLQAALLASFHGHVLITVALDSAITRRREKMWPLAVRAARQQITGTVNSPRARISVIVKTLVLVYSLCSL